MVAIVCSVVLLFTGNSFAQSAGKHHEPSSEEKKILEKAASLPAFNWPGESLRQHLFLSGDFEYSVEGVGSRGTKVVSMGRNKPRECSDMAVS